MKALIMILGLGMNLIGTSSWASMCNDPLKDSQICLNMKHIRSQLFVMGAQRDLMQINYPYLALTANEMVISITDSITHIDLSEAHIAGLRAVQKTAQEVIDLANSRDTNVFQVANGLQNKCATCHAPESPASGQAWSKIFQSDWSQIYTKCNEPNRNPYLCKSMHGMISAYGALFTAGTLERKNFPLIEKNAAEIYRITKDLDVKNMFHGSPDTLKVVQRNADELVMMARANDSGTFEKATALIQSCMACHAEQRSGNRMQWKNFPGG